MADSKPLSLATASILGQPPSFGFGFYEEKKMIKLSVALQRFVFLAVLAATTSVQAENVNFTPDNSVILNPERGLAKLMTVGDASIAELSQLREDNHTIAWGLIRLDGYRNTSVLPAAIIDEIKRWLDEVRASRVKSVLRIVYHEVTSFDSPEASLAIQDAHLEQLGAAVFIPYDDVIIAYQAGGIGAYGEWFYTPPSFTSSASRKQLLDKMFDVIADDAFVMVRTPYYKQEYEASGGRNDRVYRTAHFNDCFLSNTDDTGTYACYPWPGNCPAVDILQRYVSNDSPVVPVGGETCNSTVLNDCTQALNGMAYYGYSFINTLWFSSIRSKWENQGCFNTIATKLGYHFELVSAAVPDSISPSSNFTVSVTLKNTGWAPMYHTRPVYIRMMDANGNELLYYWTGADPRNWKANNQTYTISKTFVAPANIDTSSVSLSLWMPDELPANYSIAEYAIRFANQGVWDAVNGNNLLKANIPVNTTPSVATLITPTDNIQDNTPIYSWNAVSSSTWYYLWVNDSTGNKIKRWYTAEAVGCASGSGICSITPTITLANGTGQWWIRTWNTSGYGPWSAARIFNLNGSGILPLAATLVSPLGEIDTNTPSYVWNAVADSSWYYLWANDSTGNKIRQWYTAEATGCSDGVGTCSVAPATSLTSGAGQWWIRTWNSSGYGPWSAPRNFILTSSVDWYKPLPLTTFQWQLQGSVNTSYDVQLYDIDLFDTSEALIQQLQANGKKVICYFSGGSYETWRSDAGQFNSADLGNPLDGWAGERWLDIRSSNVHSIMRSRLDIALQKGCDGIEPDNMDGYINNSGFPLTATDQLDYNRLIANEAHLRGLSVGLKNDLDQIEELADYFDFAVNEQCFEYDECDLLAPFVNKGKAVFNVEYLQQYVDDADARNLLCSDAQNRQFSTLVLPLSLDDSFRYSCL